MPTTVFHDSSLSFLPPLWDNTQQNYVSTNQFYDFSSGSTSSSSPSISSSASSTSSINENSNSSLRSPETTTVDDFAGDGCYLQFVEKPYNKFRFRYKTEMQGTHGAILGESGQKTKCKTFPKVKLCNFTPRHDGVSPIIRCTLYTVDDEESKRTAHVHRLVRRPDGDTRQVQDDPHDITVYSSSDYTATFNHMTILFTKKQEQMDVLLDKKKTHMRRLSTDGSLQITITESQKTEAAQDINRMNLNKVCLRFDALIDSGAGFYSPLCPPVYSKPIDNMKNPDYNDPKICRFDRCSGLCDGKEEVFMFVEKVKKDNIKVKFFEKDEKGNIVWEAEARIVDVHHQFGIIFMTPAYKDLNIKENVTVFFKLERPTDGAASEEKAFFYTPNRNRNRAPRKRQRLDETSVPTPVLEFQSEPKNMTMLSSTTAPQAIPSSSDFEDNSLNNILAEVDNDFLQDLMSLDMPQNDELDLSKFIVDYLEDYPDTDKVSHFIKDSRFGEYVGEMQMQFDGICKPEVRSPSSDNYSPISRLNERRKASKSLDVPISQQARTVTSDLEAPNRYAEMTQVTEDNIVACTVRALNRLLQLLKEQKMNENCFRKYLLRLFAYTVGDDEDNVLHIMAASDHVPASMSMVLDALKAHNISKTVLDYRNNRQETPLLVAARIGTSEMIQLLLNTGADADAKDEKNCTARHLAVIREVGGKEVLTELVKKPFDVFICNEDGYSAFHLTVLYRKPELASILLVKHENIAVNNKNYVSDIVNQQDMKHGNTALHLAVHYGYKDCVNLLLGLGENINVNSTNFAGKTPLASVVGAEDSEAKKIEQLLLACQANPALLEIEKIEEDFKDELDYDEGTEEEEEEVEDEEDEEYDLTAYAREWGESGLFDGDTIMKLCPLLDKKKKWKTLVRKLKFMESEIHFCEDHWSPSLLAMKTIADSKPQLTIDIIRDNLMTISPKCAQYIDDMILKNLGLE